MVEEGAQPMGARQRRAGIRVPALMVCDPRRGDMGERARRELAEARLVNDGLCRLRASPGLAPGARLGVRRASSACAR